MRIKSKSRNHFWGYHKGAEINIERETQRDRWYIIVTHKDGCYLYDGWAPENIRTIAEAKREAIRGSML